MKFNTCPGLHPKYAGTFAGISAAAPLAVTTAAESMVTHNASANPALTTALPVQGRSLRGREAASNWPRPPYRPHDPDQQTCADESGNQVAEPSAQLDSKESFVIFGFSVLQMM